MKNVFKNKIIIVIEILLIVSLVAARIIFANIEKQQSGPDERQAEALQMREDTGEKYGTARVDDAVTVEASEATEEEKSKLPVVETLPEPVASPMAYNTNENLCVPTQMIKLGTDYFIVDCYHNQIVTSEDPQLPLLEWKVMTDQINMGHTIASDGVLYVCDDTENNRLLVFKKNNGIFEMTQVVNNVGQRPHFVSFNNDDNMFYVLSSLTGEFFKFKDVDGALELVSVSQVSELDGVYVRSFTFIDGHIFLPAGNAKIYEIETGKFDIVKTWELPDELGGPTQITKFGNNYYLTVSTDINGVNTFATLVRAKELSDFAKGDYEDIKGRFAFDGTPYVITAIDGHYYLAFHSDNGDNCLWYFDIDENDFIDNVRQVFVATEMN